MTLTAAQRATLETRLAEAEEELHARALGQGLASVSNDGRSTSFSATSTHELRAYVAQLKRQLGRGGGRMSLRPVF